MAVSSNGKTEDSALENRVSNLETKFEVFVQEMKDFKDEMKDFKAEMRDRDNQRAAEMSEIRATLNGLGNHVRSLTITAMIGIGAMVISGGAIAVAVIYSVLK